MTQFAFLEPEFADIFTHARQAETLALSDPRGACFYARLALETAVKWLYAHDRSLRSPYDTALSALIHEGTFRALVGNALVTKARIIKDYGNNAAHDSRSITPQQAVIAVRELFHFSYWLARTYAQGTKPDATLAFQESALHCAVQVEASTLAKYRALAAAHDEAEKARASEQAARIKSEEDQKALDAEIKRLQAEIAAVKAANQQTPDTHDYNEAQTRDAFIDLLLGEAGWRLDQPRDREYEVTGMPNQTEKGFVDYVLWGDDGRPLALVEAKRTKRDARVGQQQAKLYADCLEKQFGRRPLIFYSNGYEHWLWDDARHPPRWVHGFLKKDELELWLQRQSSRKPLTTTRIDESIVERYYQTRAIRRVGEMFEKDNQRKALLVMATGSGKTRTVIALVDQMMRANWVKRVLFLADRVALVKQAHRSVYRKYRAIFDYFDCLLVGLTATPRDEIDRDTYALFELESGVPTDSYDLDEAVKDGFLVPPVPMSVPLKFQREGIKYDDLPDDEKEKWDLLEWEDQLPPDQVDAAAVNKWLFNEDTVDKVLIHLMTYGLKVAEGDRLGKTIIFAKNHDHAMFIAQRFDANYPHLAGQFARVIDFKTEYAQSLIDDFSKPDSAPHIAISVDMLDTGIDVPEVVNLVFFKIIRSKTKFWQMIGRGTRLRPNLFGPGRHKENFLIFDFCQNFEFFNQNPAVKDGAIGVSLSQRLFGARVELTGLIQSITAPERGDLETLLGDVKKRLYDEVRGMSIDNFIVRPKRKAVEQFQDQAAWTNLSAEDQQILIDVIAGLPTAVSDSDIMAKQFDMLVLNGQLALLKQDSAIVRCREKVVAIAARLETLANIPMVAAQMPLILEVQTDEYWQDIDPWTMEQMRRKLRDLIKLIEGEERKIVYTNFTDEIGLGTVIDLPDVSVGTDKARFQMKMRHFLKTHADHITIQKLRRNEQLTGQDLAELERILRTEADASDDDLIAIKANDGGLGLFIRSLVGLERDAAKNAFASFMSSRTLNSNQIEFIDLIINQLTEQGAMDPRRLYESPFTDFDDQGINGVFPAEGDVLQIVRVLKDVQERAAA